MKAVRNYNPTEDGMTQLDVSNPFAGLRTFDLPMKFEDFEKAYKKWLEGALIQEAFPTLSPDEREVMISGFLPGEFPDDE